MLNTGAYSKKYQQLERDRLRQLREKGQNDVLSSKAQLYSKQTAKRQKALEERKRAMAVAEEERRRKALEERRKAQREATNRFKSALSKIRTSKVQGHSSTAIAHRNESLRVQMYLPDKPRPPVHVQKATSERVTLGKEVEVSSQRGMQSHSVPKRTPSLDDVLRSVRGESKNSDAASSQITAKDVYRQPLSARSVSDTSLHLAHQERVNQGGKIIMQAASSLSKVVSDPAPPPREVNKDVDIVFCPVMRSPLPSNTSRNGDDMRVVSPELPDSLSSESPSDGVSSSPPLLDDSLDFESAPPSSKQATRKKKRGERVRSSSQTQPVFIPQTHSPSLIVTGLQAFSQRDDDSDSSSCDSLDYPNQPPRNRRQLRLGNNSSAELTGSGKTEPKIAGILKRNGSSAVTTAQSSQVVSTTASSIMEGGSESLANDVQTTGMSRSSKKVRFVDQVISPVASKDRLLNKARQALWSKVLPNGISADFLPNSAFTPKLRVTLSGNGVPRSYHHTPPNGITVHVPRALETSPPPSPPPVLEAKQTGSTSLPNGIPPDGKLDAVLKEEDSAKKDELLQHTCTCTSDGDGEPIAEPNDSGLVLALDKTPTDDDINELWDQIRDCLREDRKVSVPPRVFNFRMLPQQNTTTVMSREARTCVQMVPSSQTCYRVDSPTAGAPSRQKQASHRDQPPPPATGKGRAMRCHNQLHQQPVQLWKRHNLTHPHMSSQEPGASRSKTGGGSRLNSTALSLEEQKLMHSIEKLNQRLKNHLSGSPDSAQSHEHPNPSPPVTYDLPKSRQRGSRNFPKTRVRKNPKTGASASAQAVNSRAYTSDGAYYKQHF